MIILQIKNQMQSVARIEENPPVGIALAQITGRSNIQIYFIRKLLSHNSFQIKQEHYIYQIKSHCQFTKQRKKFIDAIPFNKQTSFTGKKQKPVQTRFNSAKNNMFKKQRLLKSQSLILEDRRQNQEDQGFSNNLQPLDSSIINKINSLNRKLSLKNLLKKKTGTLCAVAFWTRLSNQNRRRGTMLQPQSPMSRSSGNQTPSLQQLKTPNLLQTSLFSNLYKLEGLKQKYLENLRRDEFQNLKDEPESAHIIMEKQQELISNNNKQFNFLNMNKKIPQLQKILCSNKQVAKYIKTKQPLGELPSLTRSKLALDQILKKHVEHHHRALGSTNLSSMNSTKSIINSPNKKRNLSFKSSYSESSNQIKNLINRQKQQLKPINSSINLRK